MADDLQAIQDFCSIEITHRAIQQKLNGKLLEVLTAMAACELQQWALAAQSIEDLKRQKNYEDAWRQDYENLQRLNIKYRMKQADVAFLNPTTELSEFIAMSRDRLNADLSWQNTVLIHLDRLCVMAHCWCMDAYGMTLRIMDCKGSVVVLIPDSKTGLLRKFFYDQKFPGMGWDTAKKRKGQEDNAYWLFIAVVANLKMSCELNTDIEVLQVSKMAQMLLAGRGAFVDGLGCIMGTNNKFNRECGTTVFISELGKAGDGHELIQWIEVNLAQSGGAAAADNGGTLRQAYSTTDQGQQKDSIEFRNGLPITAITGNISMPGTPASAPDGGRWMQVSSSSRSPKFD